MSECEKCGDLQNTLEARGRLKLKPPCRSRDVSNYIYMYKLLKTWWKYTLKQLQCSSQGCKRDLSLRDRDETETFGFWSETRPRPRPSCNSTRPRWDRDVWFLPRDETETLQGRDRDVFRDLQPSALCQTMNGEPASLDVTNRHCNCNSSAVFIITKFIHHIRKKNLSIKT